MDSIGSPKSSKSAGIYGGRPDTNPAADAAASRTGELFQRPKVHDYPVRKASRPVQALWALTAIGGAYVLWRTYLNPETYAPTKRNNIPYGVNFDPRYDRKHMYSGEKHDDPIGFNGTGLVVTKNGKDNRYLADWGWFTPKR